MYYTNVEELKNAFSDIQNRVAGNFAGQPCEISNDEIIKILKVDILIRKTAKELEHAGWNTSYANSNVGSLPGKDVIEKTEYLTDLLRQEGINKLNKRQDFPLRNPKHVFDDIPEIIITPLLPEINKLLA